MSQQFLGEVRIFAGNFAPVGWAFCRGQLLSIADNDALYALLGTTYGGDGQTTFGLPDMSGRASVHQGQGNGLSSYLIGQKYGVEQVTLTTAQLPAHTHPVLANSSAASGSDPTNAVWAAGSGVLPYSTTPNAGMNAVAISNAGGSQPHENMTPFLAINFIIALSGIFPSRN